MKIYNYKRPSFVLLGLLILFFSISCSKWDSFKEYIEDGEIVYVGKLDSVKILSGNKRVKIKALLKPDPKIRKVQIFWNDKSDSMIFDVDGQSRTFEKVIPINEGIVSFMFYIFDVNGNRSVMVPAVGRVYGDRYLNSLSNRLIENAVVNNNVATIDWLSMDLSNGPIATEVKYISNTGLEKIVKVPISQSRTELADLGSTTKTFAYRTLFLPQANSIDTFYTEFAQMGLARDVTSEYLKNYKNPVLTSSRSGRWAVPQDWIINSAVKNYRNSSGEYFGGVDYDFGGPFLAMEAGWSADNMVSIVNGKIYQRVLLPAGNYKFEMDIPDCTAGGDFYTVVSKSVVIPNTADIGNSIGFLKTNAQGTHVLSFTLNEATEVSLGFVGNLPNLGSGNGTFWRINAVRLKQTILVQ